LAQGVIIEHESFLLMTEEEIFGRRKHQPTKNKKSRVFDAIDDLRHLRVGDHVVHVEHGVGRYQGLLQQRAGGITVDVLAIEYQAGDRLLLPVYRLNQIQKYSGEGLARLDRLGGQTFLKTKSKIRKKVRDLADQLLRVYSIRHQKQRPPIPAPGDDYLTFEASFPYEETPDQAAAILDVVSDLQADTVMDRLVCGDVGFGKTEVALRAAFLAAHAGRQVALLCPTTVLSDQHLQTFLKRFEPSGMTVRGLSRFESKAAVEKTLHGLRLGSVDIVVGTHRVLSKDVFFKNLGLLIIDEEQRFGVAHKERLKELKSQVDVLTLTATPIPRTLNLAVGGLRDMSVILTPPEERRSIRTFIARHDEQLLTQAIRRELARGGQVFYVYNRVEGLVERAARLRELMPDLKFGVVHGQQSERELETQMHAFVQGTTQVLCATAIIESGLDIPRANTIIIDRADLFGLAQLYQLRGRVGRSTERAYCYLLVPAEEQLSKEARQRIETLERYSELGSGFQVASMDMELRGAGDILGGDQTGFSTQVGFELFAQMLAEATAELSGEDYVPEVDPELSLDVEAYLPDSYIEDVGVRLSLYKRYASAADAARVIELDKEVSERFGTPPAPARMFSLVMLMKAELRQLRIVSMQATKAIAHAHLRQDTPITSEQLVQLVAAKPGQYTLSPDGRITRRAVAQENLSSGYEHALCLVAELTKPLG
ncbi:MAG TPA: transcription-repair coupling factor, partial [Polyangiaceae bacterium]|nr:transcription-repair coupling factor [Polyangiaceae bacterium]